MKIYILLVFYLLAQNIIGQSGCTPTVYPVEIFPPNTVNTGTPNVNGFNIQYLCGPNTILYDTINSMCRQVYINNFSTLFLKADCPATQDIWVKSNCTLNILDGASVINIHVEVGAVVNQPAIRSYYVTIDTCSTIVYPNINCTTGFNENYIENKFTIYPNPSFGEFRIHSDYEIKRIEVITISDQTLLSKFDLESNPFINLKNLDKGIYFVKIFHSNELFIAKKIIIN